jgi:alpha-tubulin suppressor-like RCC1 family protein
VSDGTVQCWGRCGVACNGVRADAGDDAPSAAPAPVTGLTGAAQVAVGDGAACAVRDDGTVWCWGGNFRGTFGREEPERSDVPVQVPGVTDAAGLAAADGGMFCALLRDGTALAWGGTLLGADDNPANRARRRPTPVAEAERSQAVFPVGNACCVRRSDGELRCWTGGVVEQPDGTWPFVYGPAAPVPEGPSVRDLGTCGCVLDAVAVLSCSSEALPGALLADGTVPPPPRNGCSIDRLPDVADFATWDQYGCALHTDGRVSCWGTLEPVYGAYNPAASPVAVPLPARAVALGMGLLGAVFVLDETGAVWGWGRNSEHAIPGGPTPFVAAPTRILP